MKFNAFFNPLKLLTMALQNNSMISLPQDYSLIRPKVIDFI